MFDTKITTLTNTVTANAKKVERGLERLTGVTNDIATANAKDRENIKKRAKTLEADLNTALKTAVAIGEAKAKAVQERIAEHLKGAKRYLQVELVERTEGAADDVLKIIEGNRQKIADNYLSLKAYACAVSDKVMDEVAKGKGRALSSIGDLLMTIGAQGPVHAPVAQGPAMGGCDDAKCTTATIPQIFSGKSIKVSGAV